MTITLKPLTAHVIRDDNVATIEVKNDEGVVVLSTRHPELHTKLDPVEGINDHLVQMKSRGLNIVALETNMPGVELR
jgi:hypothetical protein